MFEHLGRTGTAWLAIGTITALAPPAAAEIRLAPDVVVLGPLDVLARHTEHEAGTDWVRFEGHEPWALVAPGDPDYAGHVPVDPAVVAEAWRSVHTAFRTRLPLVIVCLPRPREALPNSSAEDGLIYLSPGANGYDPAQVSFLLAHEMGHCAHRAFLDDDDPSAWGAYRRVRGIEDASVYHDWAPHAYRPREIFAEDFRYLFGGRLANYAGSIENPDLPLPDAVAGLEAYMLGLTGETAEAPASDPWAVASLHVAPQPARDGTAFVVDAGGTVLDPARALAIVDVRGRTIARLAGTSAGSGLTFRWDGRTFAGRRAAPGIFFASLEGNGPRASGRVVVVR